MTEPMTPQERKSYHAGHGYYVRGRTLAQCHNAAMKAGWLAAEKAYALDAIKKAERAAAAGSFDFIQPSKSLHLQPSRLGDAVF